MSSVVDIKRADPPRTDRHTRYLLICSGEDGVGKSSVCTNLAIVLARSGYRVCILDADPGLTNIHHLLGITSNYSLADVARDDCTLRDAVRQGPGDVSLALDGGYRDAFAELDAAGQHRFINQLSEWERGFDFILIDTAAGHNEGLQHFVDLVDELLLVLAPRPSALSESFAMLRRNPQACKAKPKHVVLNAASSAHQAEIAFEKFRSTVKKYLDSNVLNCGYIAADDSIRNGFALQHPVALYDESDPACGYFYRLAQTLQTQLIPRIQPRSALSDKLSRATGNNTSDLTSKTPVTATEIDQHRRLEKMRAQLLAMPALAKPLLRAGLVHPAEIETLCEQLNSLQHIQPSPSLSPSLAEDVISQESGSKESQQSLLNALQSNRASGKSLDELLNDFLDE